MANFNLKHGIGILDGRDFSVDAINMLRRLGRIAIYDGHELDSFLSDKTILFIRLGYKIDRNFLIKCPLLSIIVSPTTGLAHIDLGACRDQGISVLSLKGHMDFLQGIAATAEHTLGLIIALMRNYRRAFLTPVNCSVDRNDVRGHDVRGSTVGILGFGRVGRQLALPLQALRARVCAHDVRWLDDVPGEIVQCPSPAALADVADVFVIAASYESGRPPIVDAALLDRLTGKYVINIARGELVDEDALLDRLSHGAFRGVALDVIAAETCINNRLEQFLKLIPHQNLIITPHIGGATFESSEAVELYMVRVLADFLERQS